MKDKIKNKAQTTQDKWLGMFGLFLICFALVMAIPQIIHFDNPVDNTITSNKSIELNFNITESDLKTVKFNWNNTNYTIFDNSLVLMYNFDNRSSLGESDSLVKDLSGNGNDGTVTSASWTSSGKYDGAFEFDGVNDLITISDDVSLCVAEQDDSTATWSFWINLKNDATNKMIFRQGSTSPSLQMYATSSEGLRIDIKGENSSDTFWVPSGGNIEVDKWISIILTYNSTNLFYYLNGVEQDSVNIGQSFFNHTGNILLSHSVHFFNGSIDEVRIWNKSLTSSEIQQNYLMNLKKYDVDKWSLYVNQTDSDGDYNYFACATNSSDTENCTSTRTITLDTTYPKTEFVAPTPANGSFILWHPNNILNINISINEANLEKVIFNWNGTNYSVYDTNYTDLLLYFKFDNDSTYGENDNLVYDYSGNQNGTVYNMNWIEGYGKINGGFNFTLNDSAGARKYIGISQPSFNGSSDNWTFGVWIKPYNNGNSNRKHIINLFGDYDGWISWHDSGYASMNVRHPSDNSIRSSSNSFPEGEWHYLTYSHEALNDSFHIFKIYVDGDLDSEENVTGIIKSSSSGTRWIGSYNGYASLDYLVYNGSIDEMKLWNSTLNASKIKAEYFSLVRKLNSSQYYLEIEKIVSAGGESYDYFVCSIDEINQENCTETRNLIWLSNQNITSNFSSSIGDIRDDFYGVNIQNPKWMFGGYNYDTDCDGVSDTAGNTTLNKEEFLNGKFGTMRLDYDFDTYYGGVNNLDFEEWSNTSVGFFNSATGSGSRGWSVSVGGGGTGFVLQSADSHSDSYSLNVTCNQSSSTYVYHGGINFIEGKNYNASIWIKGKSGAEYNMVTKVITPYTICGSQSFTGTGNWQQVSVECTASSNSTNYAIVIDSIGVGEDILLDDWNITEDGEDLRWWSKGDTSRLEEQVLWDYENNVRSLVIFWAGNPTFLANWSHPNCLGTGTGDGSCPPFDYDIANNITLNAIKRLSRENNEVEKNIDIEFKNEPYGTHSGACSYDSITCALDYVEFYNHTYNTIKAYNSNISIGGPSGYKMSMTPNILTTFFTNMSNKFDFVTFHPYSQTMINNNMYNDFYSLKNNCTSLGGGVGCNRIINSEWQPTLPSMNQSTGQSDWYKSNIAIPYLSILNYIPNNASLHYYHWKDSQSYFNCPSRYYYYPTLYSGISDKGMDNATHSVYYPPYTVTKNFATYCRKKGNMHNTIVINKGSEAINLTLNLENFTENTIYNLETKTAYTVTDNSTNIGSIDQYEILYLGSDLQSPTITINSPSNTTYTSNTTYFNLTLDEEGDTCYYSLDGASNITMTKQGVVTQFKAVNSTMTDGSHTVVFSCNDTWDNWNSTSVTFLIDTTNPVITKYTPSSNLVITTKQQIYSFNVFDINNIKNCSLIFDGIAVSTNNSINQSSNQSFNYTHSSYGIFYWSIECIDESLKTGTTGNISIQFYTEDGEDDVDGGNGGSGNTKINNTLIDSVLIKIYNLDNSFIYFSNGTILSFLNGDLNITLTGSEYFYIINFDGYYKFNENNGTTAHDTSGNDNHGTITGATWNNDGVLVTLTEDVDYEVSGTTFTLLDDDLSYAEVTINYNNEVVINDLNGTATDVIDGIGSVTDWFEIFIVITAMVVLILLTVIIITAIRGSGMMGESA